jgi:hypothetical protein
MPREREYNARRWRLIVELRDGSVGVRPTGREREEQADGASVEALTPVERCPCRCDEPGARFLDRRQQHAANYNDRMLALRYAYVLALVVWLGGMVVLGAVVAPAVFQVLQVRSPDAGRLLAGAVFGTALDRFHYVAYACGGVILITLLVMAVLGPRPTAFAVRVALASAMLGIALYSGLVVLRSVDHLQQEIGINVAPSSLPADDTRRVRFDQLHVLSTRLMMINMLGALVLLYWEARE